MTWRVIQGDCVEAMAALEPCSVGAVVCDPPYGLGVEPDTSEVLRAWLAGERHAARGGGFMGKSWDAFVPGPEVWRECYRVLKPGGHLLSFAGTRTVDLIGIGIRLAGFERRDLIAYMFGSGFPKSLDVSKQINRQAGAEREEVGPSPRHGGGIVGAGSPYELPPEPHMLTAPATPEAQQWEGWGTALKPAHEPVVVARKPLSGTVAANVLEHGTGALNVDGCRIEGASYNYPDGAGGNTFTVAGDPDGSRTEPVESHPAGRWPANVVLDEQSSRLLDEQTGELPAGTAVRRNKGIVASSNVRYSGDDPTATEDVGYGDSGGASRFFYVAKASRAERNAGLDGFEEKVAGDMSARADGSLDGHIVTARNVHPTAKPIDLMRWLTRLVTPPGGTVLDPFTGSGTTGCAAVLEGFDFIGIEREPEYAEIAEARIRWWERHRGEGEADEILAAARRRDELEGSGQVSFDWDEAA